MLLEKDRVYQIKLEQSIRQKERVRRVDIEKKLSRALEVYCFKNRTRLDIVVNEVRTNFFTNLKDDTYKNFLSGEYTWQYVPAFQMVKNNDIEDPETIKKSSKITSEE